MINKKEFEKMHKQLRAYDMKREELINQSRIVLKKAKLMIYSIQRNKIKDAEKEFKNLQKEKLKLNKITKSYPKLMYEGSLSQACQEYVEAAALLDFVKGRILPNARKLNVSTKDYLLGIADLTGELVRLAIAHSIKGNFDKVEHIKDNVGEIWAEFLKFDFRNSKLRKKFDSIKYNLAKLENIMYDISIKSRKK